MRRARSTKQAGGFAILLVSLSHSENQPINQCFQTRIKNQSHSDWRPGTIVSHALEVFPNPRPPGSNFTHLPLCNQLYSPGRPFRQQVNLKMNAKGIWST